jgi:hypothetical protein
MGLYEDLKSGGYLDPEYGMVSIYPHTGPGPNCSNYWLFTAIAKALLNNRPWHNVLSFYMGCLREPGLIYRFPNVDSDVSQQEIAAAVSLFPEVFFFIYGCNHSWCFNVQNPGHFTLNYWFGRFIDFPAFVKSQTTGHLGVLGQLLWSIAITTTTMTDYGNTSEKVYKWMQVEKMRGRHVLTNWAIQLWSKLMQKKYPGGPKELFSIYFPKEHPFIQYAPDQF